ncbi:ATP-binding cassette domain-containing protein [Massilia sp. W12]|uniref:ATP-binding cassette domain-containing protein n=1 Tax=Massilia sp. W12 TaxID=3126507 RepID=UPI0030CC908B
MMGRHPTSHREDDAPENAEFDPEASLADLDLSEVSQALRFERTQRASLRAPETVEDAPNGADAQHAFEEDAADADAAAWQAEDAAQHDVAEAAAEIEQPAEQQAGEYTQEWDESIPQTDTEDVTDASLLQGQEQTEPEWRQQAEQDSAYLDQQAPPEDCAAQAGQEDAAWRDEALQENWQCAGQSGLDVLEELIVARTGVAREQARCLCQPGFFLDDPVLPPWLYVRHAGAELYAQPFAAGRASGPRRFLAHLPPHALLPALAPHPHWRLLVAPGAPACVDACPGPQDAPQQEISEQELQAWQSERQSCLQALQPLLHALQEIVPSVTSPALVDLYFEAAPHARLQQWLHACLDEIRDQRKPMPLAQIEAANLDARQSALIKMATVLEPRARPKNRQNQSLASVACVVAQAQGLHLHKDADQGVPDESLHDWAKRSGLRLRKVALRSGWRQASGLPLLAFYADEEGRPPDPQALRGPAIALLPDAERPYCWQDASGASGQVDEAFAARLAPFAWSLHGRLPDKVLHIPDLLSFGWRAALQDIGLLLGGALSAGILGILSPLAVSYVFHSVIPSSELSLLLNFALLVLLVSVVAGVLHFSADLAALRIEGRLGSGLQSAIFDRLLRLPLAFYASLTSGDLANRIATVDVVRRSLASYSVAMLTSLCYTAGALATMCYYMPRAALLVALCMLIFWCVAALLGWKMVKSLYEGEQIEGNIIAMVVQLVQGINKLRLGGAEDRAFGLWGRGFAELRTRLGRGKILNVYLLALVALLETALPATVFALLGYGDGEKPDTASFLALIAALATYSASGLSVGQTLCRLISLKPLFERIRPILQNQPVAAAEGEDPGPINGALEVAGLSFRWPGQRDDLLHDISFQAPSGSFTAIVGSSGCGKSTLLRLLLGLEQASAGSIYYDGRDLRSLNQDQLRRQIGVVLQSGKTMPGTLYENISVSHPCSIEQAWEAARLAGLEEDIRAMPMGMHTVLPEGGAALSGGQAQRLLLARALAGQPQILLLDEATSALDNRTQAWITSSLAAMAMTRVVIAHRLSTVQKADQILVLHQGRIAERGTYQELMEMQGLFAALAARQLS